MVDQGQSVCLTRTHSQRSRAEGKEHTSERTPRSTKNLVTIYTTMSCNFTAGCTYRIAESSRLLGFNTQASGHQLDQLGDDLQAGYAIQLRLHVQHRRVASPPVVQHPGRQPPARSACSGPCTLRRWCPWHSRLMRSVGPAGFPLPTHWRKEQQQQQSCTSYRMAIAMPFADKHRSSTQSFAPRSRTSSDERMITEAMIYSRKQNSISTNAESSPG